MWVWSAFVLSLAMAALAWWRSGARVRTFYEGEVYGMGPAGHRAYATFFGAFALVFLVELARPVGWLSLATMAVVVLGAILYGTSFLRGASGEDE